MEEKNKKGKGSTLVIILLLIIILGLVGYIYYTSTIAPKETKQEESISQSTEEGSVISDSLINALLDLVPEAEFPIIKQNSDINEVDHYVVLPYDETHNSIDTIDESILNEMAFNSASEKYGTIDSTDKSEIQPAACISREHFDKELKQNYNKTAERYYDYKEVPNGTGNQISITENSVCIANASGGIVTHSIFSKTDKSIYNGDNIEIYVSILFVDSIPDSDGENMAIFNDYNFSNKLEESVKKIESHEDYIIIESNMMSKYYKQASKYKHTFKPNDDGGYYWYSTEKVE